MLKLSLSEYYIQIQIQKWTQHINTVVNKANTFL